MGGEGGSWFILPPLHLFAGWSAALTRGWLGCVREALVVFAAAGEIYATKRLRQPNRLAMLPSCSLADVLNGVPAEQQHAVLAVLNLEKCDHTPHLGFYTGSPCSRHGLLLLVVVLQTFDDLL